MHANLMFSSDLREWTCTVEVEARVTAQIAVFAEGFMTQAFAAQYRST